MKMKVVGIDNFARETVADILVKENISLEEAGRLASELNSGVAEEPSRWYVVRSDDYQLWRGKEELV
jgi:hypothetical protein